MTASDPAAPLNIHSTRGAHFRTMIGSGSAIVTWAVVSTIVFGFGASKHSAPVMGGGPFVVALVVIAYVWYKATQDSENEFFKRFADVHGLNLWSEYALPEFTPLLSGGDRRHCEHWMEKDGRALGWYTFEVRHDNGDKPDTYEAENFTIATVDVGEHGMKRFEGIYLRRRLGLFDRLDSDANWWRHHSLKKVPLESTAFNEKYELRAEEYQDDLTLRQLFSPSFVVWLTDHPLAPGFELRAGTLVVFIPGHCGEAGRLQFLMMAADAISKRIQTELTEAAQAGSL